MKLEETMAQREKNQAREKCNESAYVYSENVVYLAAQILERRGFEVWELPHANEVMLGSMSVLLRAERGRTPMPCYSWVVVGTREEMGFSEHQNLWDITEKHVADAVSALFEKEESHALD